MIQVVFGISMDSIQISSSIYQSISQSNRTSWASDEVAVFH